MADQKTVADLAEQLADCRARVRAYGMVNTRGLTHDAEMRAGALMTLAQTALDKAQHEYDEAVSGLTAQEVADAGKMISSSTPG